MKLEEYKLKAKRILSWWDERINFDRKEQILLESLSAKLQSSRTKKEFGFYFNHMKQFHEQHVKPVVEYETTMKSSLMSVPEVPVVARSYRNESDFDIAMRMATSFFKEVKVNTSPSTNDVIKAQEEELNYYKSLRK